MFLPVAARFDAHFQLVPFAVEIVGIKADDVLIFDFLPDFLKNRMQVKTVLNFPFEGLPAARFADFRKRRAVEPRSLRSAESLTAAAAV